MSYGYKKMHERREKDSAIKTEYKDEFEYDISYNQSYTLVIFLNCLIFSCFVPLIALIGAIYFYLKYLIDKYNLMFVYNKNYESGGKIRIVVTRFMYFNLLIY